MRRREVLSVLAGTVGSVVLAGCGGLVGEDGPAATRTLTPVAVPTTERETVTRTGCPELPSNAEVYVCSPQTDGGESLRLVPESSTYDGTGGFGFTLSNGTSFPFRTGRDWWTLSQLSAEGWSISAQGDGSDRTVVGPREAFTWTLDGAANGDGTVPLEVDLDRGRYALAITGYVAGGELTAVITPFRSAPAEAYTGRRKS
ncbi:MAG: hypothetical protein ABEH56_04055 [Salinirussus sp.]